LNATSSKKSLLWLAIDDKSLPLRHNLCHYITKPTVRKEPVLVPSPKDSNAPDNSAVMFYGTVLNEPGPFGGNFRMWYHACHTGMSPDWTPDQMRQFAKYKDPMIMGPICYAESDDGINWRRPNVRQFKFKGTLDHNAIDMPHGLTAGANIIRDDEDPDPARRYKMIYEIFPRHSDPPLEGLGKTTTVAMAISPDGMRWTYTGIPYVDYFIEQAGFYKHDGKYIINYQAGDGWGSHFSEGGNTAGRCGLARYSYDFNTWVEGYADSLSLPEPRDPAKRGSKMEYIHNHLGTAAVSYGNVCVGLYGLWYNKPAFHDISCDFGLAVSNDGLTFREPVKGHVFLDNLDSPVTQDPEIHLKTNLTQSNGMMNVGDETWIYHGRWRNTGFQNTHLYYGEIALATIGRDRWGAMGLYPNRDNGVLWSEPVTLADIDQPVTVNAEGAAGLTIEIVGEKFEPIAKGIAIRGSAGFDMQIEWPATVRAAIRNRLIRIGVRFQRVEGLDSRAYALNVTRA